MDNDIPTIHPQVREVMRELLTRSIAVLEPRERVIGRLSTTACRRLLAALEQGETLPPTVLQTSVTVATAESDDEWWERSRYLRWTVMPDRMQGWVFMNLATIVGASQTDVEQWEAEYTQPPAPSVARWLEEFARTFERDDAALMAWEVHDP